MGVYIKGMSKTKHCINCPLMMCDSDGDWCALQDEETNESFKSWDDMRKHCPLVEVKEPHGDLIDRDALEDIVIQKRDNEMLCDCDDDYSNGKAIAYDLVDQYIVNAPTVIEAEGNDED